LSENKTTHPINLKIQSQSQKQEFFMGAVEKWKSKPRISTFPLPRQPAAQGKNRDPNLAVYTNYLTRPSKSDHSCWKAVASNGQTLLFPVFSWLYSAPIGCFLGNHTRNRSFLASSATFLAGYWRGIPQVPPACC